MGQTNYTAVTATSGAVYDLVLHSTTTPVMAQTTVTFTTTGCVQAPIPGGTVVSQNTSINSGVACGTVSLSWGADAGTTTYYIYRNAANTTPTPGTTTALGTTASTSYSDATPTDAGGDYYWVSAYNSTFGGYSTPTIATPVPISNTPCSVNFTTTQMPFTQVQPGGTGSFLAFASVTSIRAGDVVTGQIQLTNTGTIAAQNVVVVVTPTNLTNPGTFLLNGVSWPVTAPSTGAYTLPTIASIPANTTTTITYNALVTQPGGAGTGLYRFSSSSATSYTTTLTSNNGACISTGTDSSHQCIKYTASEPFYNGPIAPVQHEVAP